MAAVSHDFFYQNVELAPAERVSLAAAADPTEGHKHDFSPYTINGGTNLAITGPDFAVVAADTRMSHGYNVMTRYSTKIIQLTPKCVLASSGMQADRAALHKQLRMVLATYKHQHGKDMSTPAIAQKLSTILYYRRFFPYYTFNTLGGVDDDGVGAVYSYDAVGSFERCVATCQGSGQGLIQPLLDNQAKFQNQNNVPTRQLNKEQVVDLVRDAFTGCGERDIYTGDSVEICVITADGVHYEQFALKKD